MMSATMSISLATVCYIAYHFTIHSTWIGCGFIERYGALGAKSRWVMAQRLTGAFLFGLVPLLIFRVAHPVVPLAEIGLTFHTRGNWWPWALGLGATCVFVNYFACQKEDHLEMYPQIRTPLPWGRGLLFASSFTLILYTLAYEIMFRGYLLFSCAKDMGNELAVVVNTSIYALAHISKGWKETVGAIPMGIVLCWTALESGNIWTAVWVHVVLALSSEWFSIAQHKKRASA